MLSQVASWTQYAALGLLFFGDSVFNTLGIAPPGLYQQAKDNKAWSAFLVFMIGNQINAGLLTTGAFEVEDGFLAARCIQDNQIICRDLVQSETVFSKLETGRFPGIDEVLDAVEGRDNLQPQLEAGDDDGQFDQVEVPTGGLEAKEEL